MYYHDIMASLKKGVIDIMRFFTALVFIFTLTTSSLSEETGIAIFQAPEAGGGICFGQDGEKTIACARQKCIEDTGLESEDCIASAWCYPMGWTGDLFVQHKEGPHWHEFICGQIDKVSLQKAAAVKCNRDYLIACNMVQMWSPEGKEIKIH